MYEHYLHYQHSTSALEPFALPFHNTASLSLPATEMGNRPLCGWLVQRLKQWFYPCDAQTVHMIELKVHWLLKEIRFFCGHGQSFVGTLISMRELIVHIFALWVVERYQGSWKMSHWLQLLWLAWGLTSVNERIVNLDLFSAVLRKLVFHHLEL